MTSAHLQQWIQHPETLNSDTLHELRALVARYPYFQSLRLLYLKNLYLLHDINFGAELRKAVPYVADRSVLFYLIEGNRFALKSRKALPLSADEQEKEPDTDRTLSLIDAFLATVPEEHSQNTELDYAVDYTAYLMQEDDLLSDTDVEGGQEVPKLRGHELIDNFIQKSESPDASDTRKELFAEKVKDEEEPEEEVSEEEEEEEDASSVSLASEEWDDSCFTETLAKIYIKQHRYDKALEIIKKLSLNYPKKNAYFADQIRFLEKLIINAKSK
ncbi:MAG: tetratricopeptide repeat protein [Bacteroides sp.]|nr:tetratricopeptide repeat protein [Bacteroides sp.]